MTHDLQEFAIPSGENMCHHLSISSTIISAREKTYQASDCAPNGPPGTRREQKHRYQDTLQPMLDSHHASFVNHCHSEEKSHVDNPKGKGGYQRESRVGTGFSAWPHCFGTFSASLTSVQDPEFLQVGQNVVDHNFLQDFQDISQKGMATQILPTLIKHMVMIMLRYSKALSRSCCMQWNHLLVHFTFSLASKAN